MNIFDSARKFSLWNENSASYLNVHGVPWVTNWNWFLEVCIWKINWNSDVENSVNKLWNRWPLKREIIATAKGPSFFFFSVFIFAPWQTMVKYDQRFLIPSQLGAGEDLTKVDQFLAVWVFVCLWLTFLFESHLKQWSHTPLFPNGPLVSLGWPPLMIDPTDVEHGGV